MPMVSKVFFRVCWPAAPTGCSRTSGTSNLLPLLLLLSLPVAMQAQWSYTTNNGTITITGYTGPGGTVNIPGTINNLPVTKIGDNAFNVFLGNTSPTSVTMPDSVTSIGSFVFSEC